MDNGKISITNYKGIPVSSIYTSDEITLTDVEWSITTLQNHFPNPTPLIVQKNGDYWISVEAQKRLIFGINQIKEMIIIAENKDQLMDASLAEKSFLMNMPITICTTIEEAFKLIQLHT